MCSFRGTPVLVLLLGAILISAGFAPILVAAVAIKDQQNGQPPPPADDSDPPAVAIGERLFLETRFAQFFFAHSGGDANAQLATGDPVMDGTVTTDGALPGPFAGGSMNCRSCHLVDEHGVTPGAGNRTYADFARRSPIPSREDGRSVTARNSPPLVNATLPRKRFLLHFDGEFATTEDLARETLLGRNFGWLPTERAQAVAHIAHIIRDDGGQGDLAQASGGAYRTVLKGKDRAIPAELLLPPAFRVDVDRADDIQIVDAVSGLIAAYVESLSFSQDARGEFNGSPFDVFLLKNGLPRGPGRHESDQDYSRRLLALLDQLANPQWVGPGDGAFRLHDQPFVFGPLEMEGLEAFLREPPSLPLDSPALQRGGIGNCVACHPAPTFTDFGLHNTGVAQSEYDAIHGPGAFAALNVPSLNVRKKNFDQWLPPTPAHPLARGPFLAVPAPDRPGETDLGVWNVFANPDHYLPQSRISSMLCAEGKPCTFAALLDRAVARFKTPGLRDLGHSGPYLHTGQSDRLRDVLALYVEFSELARAGGMRNPAPELRGMALTADDVEALAAFLRALNEDYE